MFTAAIKELTLYISDVAETGIEPVTFDYEPNVKPFHHPAILGSYFDANPHSMSTPTQAYVEIKGVEPLHITAKSPTSR